MAEHEPSIGATSEWFTPPELLRGPRTSPSHGENRGSSPLGSATSFAHSFTFKTLVVCLCKRGAVFV